MEIVKVVAVGLITVIATIIVRQVKPEIAMLITLAGSIVIIMLTVQLLQNVFGNFISIFNKTGVSSSLFVPIFKIIGIGIITVFSYIVIKQLKPEFAIIVGLAGSIILLFSISDSIISVINSFASLVEKTGINIELFSLVLKIIGIGYLTEFAANLCMDSGCNSIADKMASCFDGTPKY